MLSSFQIRRAKPSDIESLIQLGKTAWLNAFQSQAPRELIYWWSKMDRHRPDFESGLHEMHLIEIEQSIRGAVQIQSDQVKGLWVDTRYQRQGMGTILLAHAESIIRHRNLPTMWLSCASWNKDAVTFFRRSGFIERARKSQLHVSSIVVVKVRLEKALHSQTISLRQPIESITRILPVPRQLDRAAYAVS